MDHNKIIDKSRIAQPTPTNWELTEEQKLTFQSLYILYLMVKKDYRFSNFPTGNLRLVSESINFLDKKKLIQQKQVEGKVKKLLGIKYGKEEAYWIYAPTPAAKEIIKQYEQRYIEFLRFYDVYAHIDPQTGNFAMEQFAEIVTHEGEDAWEGYKKDSRWQDYRIPVAVFKGLDPREMIFFSMMEEGQFDPDENDENHSWALRLFSEDLWKEMYQILNTAPRWEDQGTDEVKPKKIMKTIIKMGAAVMKEQFEYLNEQISNDAGGHAVSDNDTYTIIEEYYDDPVYYGGAYYTPFSSPMFWITMAILI